MNISRIVVIAVLSRNGKFTLKDIVNEVSGLILQEFNNVEEMEKYIKRKIDTMCELGLLNSTGLYYFSN